MDSTAGTDLGKIVSVFYQAEDGEHSRRLLALLATCLTMLDAMQGPPRDPPPGFSLLLGLILLMRFPSSPP